MHSPIMTADIAKERAESLLMEAQRTRSHYCPGANHKEYGRPCLAKFGTALAAMGRALRKGGFVLIL